MTAPVSPLIDRSIGYIGYQYGWARLFEAHLLSIIDCFANALGMGRNNMRTTVSRSPPRVFSSQNKPFDFSLLLLLLFYFFVLLLERRQLGKRPRRNCDDGQLWRRRSSSEIFSSFIWMEEDISYTPNTTPIEQPCVCIICQLLIGRQKHANVGETQQAVRPQVDPQSPNPPHTSPDVFRSCCSLTSIYL